MAVQAEIPLVPHSHAWPWDVAEQWSQLRMRNAITRCSVGRALNLDIDVEIRPFKSSNLLVPFYFFLTTTLIDVSLLLLCKMRKHEIPSKSGLLKPEFVEFVRDCDSFYLHLFFNFFPLGTRIDFVMISFCKIHKRTLPAKFLANYC